MFPLANNVMRKRKKRRNMYKSNITKEKEKENE